LKLKIKGLNMSQKKQELNVSIDAFEVLLAYAEKHELKSPTKGGKAVLAIEHLTAKMKEDSQEQ
jgi:hypothetical protein